MTIHVPVFPVTDNVVCPLRLSDRLIGREGEDYLVLDIDHANGLALIHDAGSGTEAILQRDELVELLRLGWLVSGGFPPTGDREIRTFGSLDRRLQYCWAMDDADPRFVISEADIQAVIDQVSAEIGGPIPSPECLLKWWKRWVSNGRCDTTFFPRHAH